jgi:hypothetical protein
MRGARTFLKYSSYDFLLRLAFCWFSDTWGPFVSCKQLTDQCFMEIVKTTDSTSFYGNNKFLSLVIVCEKVWAGQKFCLDLKTGVEIGDKNCPEPIMGA